MKRKLPLNQEIYLPEYFSDTVARSFEKESEQRILYWDFRKALDEKIKMQIEILLREKSMEKQVEIYQNEIKKLLEENVRLKKENIMLTRKVEKLSMK